MCRFCIEHGEGKRWYLQAENYAFDLQSDLRRRDYVLGFVRGFSQMRKGAIEWGERLERVPAPLANVGRAAVARYMQDHHYGQPLPLEDCEQVFSLATSITVIPCICRMHAPGKNADEVCILVSTQPIGPLLAEAFASYADGPELDDFHTVTTDEALALLRRCEEQGLMHSIWTFQTPFTMAICNCNSESGCMAMRATTGYGIKMMWRGEYVAELNADRCTRCAKCVKACPFEAIVRESKAVSISTRDCWGCGICRAHCASDALSLRDRTGVAEVAAVW